MFDLCIKNGVIVDSNYLFKGNIYVKDGKIAAVTDDETVMESCEIIDAEGAYVLPGFIDPHAHLNDPGLTNSEDFYTGTCSAAAGGITTVIEHPMTVPLPCTAEILQDKSRICGKKAVVDYGLFGACTPDNIDEMKKMKEAGAAGVKAFLPYSPEIPQLKDGEIIRHMERLAEVGLPMILHCENDAICKKCTEELIEQGKIKAEDYPNSRPEIAECEAISRIAQFALYTGASVHIAHCSVPEGVEIVREYQKRGADITVETCSHYLTLNSDTYADQGVFAVCNPPLRKKSTVDKLWKCLLEGKIDFVGSDHCAYTYEEKDAGTENIFNTPPGITGIQTCFPLLYDGAVATGKMGIEEFVKLSSVNAARRYGLFPEKGSLQIGTDADITILNPKRETVIDEKQLFYMIKWAPYIGWKLKCHIDKTIVRGKTIYDNGSIVGEAGYGRQVQPGK